MLSIFTDTQKPRGAVTTHPTTARFQELIKKNVVRLQEYYQSNVRAVDNNHPLVQLLKHLPPYTEDAVNLFTTAASRYPYLSKTFKFTTDYNTGSLIGHKVYPTSDNMIYMTSEYVRPYQAVSDWKNLRPVKVLWKDSPYIDMSVPDLKDAVKSGLSAITVDLPMLALMYKGFKESMVDNELVLGEDQFIATWVLPTIIESQLDSTCVSALISLYRGQEQLQSRVDAPIYLDSYGIEFNKLARYALNRIEGSKMQYIHMLQSMPVVYGKAATDALILPDYAPTTQVEWAMLASRLKVIDFLLDVGGKLGRDANKGFINQLKPYCRDIQMARIPYSQMSDSLATYMDTTLTKIRNLK